MTLNVKKAMEVVQKFEMVWPHRESNDPRGQGKPPLKQQQEPFAVNMMGIPVKETTTGERMGLYRKGMTGPTPLSYNPLTAE